MKNMLVACHLCGSKDKRDTHTLLCDVPTDEGEHRILWGHVDCIREALPRLRPDIRVMAGPGQDIDPMKGVRMGDLEGEGYGQPTLRTWFELDHEA